MTLGELIEALSKVPPETKAPIGFGLPHSYRGFYDDLAFRPMIDTTAGEMLAAAKEALGTTYTGYKGGKYEMNEYTCCWMSEHGESNGEVIGPVLLAFMFGEDPVATALQNEETAYRHGGRSKIYRRGIVADPRPCAWWLREPDMGTQDVTVTLHRQLDGKLHHVVTMAGSTWRLSRVTGDFDYQPIPSSRTEEWIRDHTFGSLEEAVAAGQAALAKGV